MTTPPVTWYFDPISPYAWLAWNQLHRLPAGTALHLQPVLFAGLLQHWGHKGPAEIEPKRTWTYRDCLWRARRDGIAFRMPAAHPFNPLPWLRLVIAAGNTPAAVGAVFEALWTRAADPADPALLAEVRQQLGVDAGALDDPAVKAALRAGTQAAVARGVFGVPTLAVGEALYWGADAIDFAAEHLRDPAGWAADAERARLDALPVGVARPGS